MSSAGAQGIARLSMLWLIRLPWRVPDGSGAVGSAVRRVDGLAKVSGTEAFGDDIAPPDTLVLRVIRSPHAHAGFVLGDVEEFVTDSPGSRRC